MKLKLIGLNPPEENRKVVLRKLPAVLGRSSEAEVTVEDRWVSRRHCEITEIDGLLVVRDLGSKHGTFVNGQRVDQARLLPEDTITVGLTSFAASYRGGVRANQPASVLGNR